MFKTSPTGRLRSHVNASFAVMHRSSLLLQRHSQHGWCLWRWSRFHFEYRKCEGILIQSSFCYLLVMCDCFIASCSKLYLLHNCSEISICPFLRIISVNFCSSTQTGSTISTFIYIYIMPPINTRMKAHFYFCSDDCFNPIMTPLKVSTLLSAVVSCFCWELVLIGRWPSGNCCWLQLSDSATYSSLLLLWGMQLQSISRLFVCLCLQCSSIHYCEEECYQYYSRSQCSFSACALF